MRSSLLIALLLSTGLSFGQSSTSITTIDFVKIKDDRRQEALFFYTNNWKVYREIALDSGYIKSYQILTTTADSTADFDLMLMTEYADSLQYGMAEERFQKIIKAVRPNGPKLLNDLKPAAFRQNLFLKTTQTLFKDNAVQPRRRKK